MELRHLRYFVAVAEELHFRRAAARLHIAQPPLSQQIQQLERELDVKLLERTKRRVTLTDAGRVFLDEARLALVQAETAVRAARRASAGEIGRLAIGFVPVADLRVLPTVLPPFHRRYPEVQFALHRLNAAAQSEALRDRRIDVGFLYLPFSDDALVIEPVFREPLVVVLPEHHRLAAQRTVSLRSLATEPFIVFPRHRAPAFHDQILSFCNRAGFSPNVVQQADNVQTNIALSAMGLGISLQPASIQVLRRTGIVYRPLRAPAPRIEMAVVHRRHDASPVLEGFLAVVRDVIASTLARGRRARQPGRAPDLLRGPGPRRDLPRPERTAARRARSGLGPAGARRPSPPR